MQHDEVIWQVINHGHCAFKVKTTKQNFCRNEYNVSGLCNRSSCPLANSRYATIREDGGRLYLYMKTIERAHTPAKLWQRVRLHRAYAKALEQIDEHLAHFPKFLVHKNKQRLTKITQYLIRARRLAARSTTTLVPVATRTEQRERRREAKAETAAKLETSIEQELLARLRAGTYGDIYNFPTAEYEKVLDAAEEAEAEAEAGAEGDAYIEGDSEDDVEWEDEEEGGLEDVSDGPNDASDDDDDDDDDDASPSGGDIEDLGGPTPPRRTERGRRRPADGPGGKRGRREVEVEVERETASRQRVSR